MRSRQPGNLPRVILDETSYQIHDRTKDISDQIKDPASGSPDDYSIHTVLVIRSERPIPRETVHWGLTQDLLDSFSASIADHSQISITVLLVVVLACCSRKVDVRVSRPRFRWNQPRHRMKMTLALTRTAALYKSRAALDGRFEVS